MDALTPAFPVIGSCTSEGLGDTFGDLVAGTAVVSAAITGTSNLATYVPMVLSTPFRAVTFFWVNGSSVSGNVDVGLYSNNGTRLASTGSTAQSGTSTIQSVALGTAILLMPDLYYIAWVADNTTATMSLFTPAQSTSDARRFGMFAQTSAFPLPATATFASANTQAKIALVGITSRTVI